MADKLALDSWLVARRILYVSCATALDNNHEPTEALLYANKAVNVVKLGHDDASGTVAAYEVKAHAEALSSNFIAADADLATVINIQREALNTPMGHELSRNYNYALMVLLGERANVLRQLGKPAEAKVCQDEADQLLKIFQP